MDHLAFAVRHERQGRRCCAEIVARPARTLVFVRTKHGADRLARQLSRAGRRRPAPSTATWPRTRGSARWTRSPPAGPGCWSPPTSPPAASTSTTSTWSCTTTRRPTTRTTCTAPAARPGPARSGTVLSLLLPEQVAAGRRCGCSSGPVSTWPLTPVGRGRRGGARARPVRRADRGPPARAGAGSASRIRPPTPPSAVAPATTRAPLRLGLTGRRRQSTPENWHRTRSPR